MFVGALFDIADSGTVLLLEHCVQLVRQVGQHVADVIEDVRPDDGGGCGLGRWGRAARPRPAGTV